MVRGLPSFSSGVWRSVSTTAMSLVELSKTALTTQEGCLRLAQLEVIIIAVCHYVVDYSGHGGKLNVCDHVGVYG